MSVLLIKLLWYKYSEFGKVKYSEPTNITDILDLSQSRGLDIKNNVLLFRVKNTPQSLSSTGRLQHKFVGVDGKTTFNKQDQFKLYLRYTDDSADIEATEWSKSNVIEPDSLYLRGIYYLIEYSSRTSATENSIELKCADKTYILFNKLLPVSIKESDNFGSPEVFQKIIHRGSQGNDGTYVIGGVNTAKVAIEAKLFSEGVKESGTTTSATAYKLIDSAATFITNKVNRFDKVRNSTNNKYATILSVDNETQLTLNIDIMSSGDAYQVSDGFIQDTRSSVCADGVTTNADQTFPNISIAKVWKPIYETLNEISQIQYLNTLDEQTEDGGKKLVYGRPFLSYVDEINRVHWFEVQSDPSITIDVGTTKGLFSANIGKNVFDSVNMVIWRGGEDLYGSGTLGYQLSNEARANNLRMRVVAMTDISDKWIKSEIQNGNLVINASGTFTYSGNRYNAKGYPLTPGWLSAGVANNTAYNKAMREKIKEEATARAIGLVTALAGDTVSGEFELKGNIYYVGDLIDYTNSKTGQKNISMRIQDVRDLIRANGWFTNIQVAEDIPGITNLVG